jgi:4-amino-4-deoxy-L-arabinose transferase-like glycosyltransferase
MRTSPANRILRPAVEDEAPAQAARTGTTGAGSCSEANSSLALVLYGDHNGEAVRRMVGRAEDALAGLSLDYEILVIGGSEGKHIIRAAQKGLPRNSCIYYLASESPGGYAGALEAGLTTSPCSLIAVTNGTLDFRALAYLIPLARQYAVVCGYRCDSRGSPLDRALSWGFSTLARCLLGTGVRDCGTAEVVSIFHRPALRDVAPGSRTAFAPVEVLCRARQLGLPITEAPVACTEGAESARTSGRALCGRLAALLRFWWSQVQFPAPRAAPARKGSWLWGLLLMLLTSLVLFPDLKRPLQDPDEGRQAEIPREMLAHDDLLVPRMQGVPYYEKPPLQYWLTAGAYTVFGVHTWSARLVPTSAAWLTVLLTFLWGRRALGSRPALVSGLILALSLGFVMLGRTVVLDSLLATCVAAAWYTAQTAVSRPRLRWRFWLASAVICGLGILVKGPVALVLLAVPVFVYQALTMTAARPRGRAWAAYVAVAIGVAAPWYVAMAVRDPDYANQFFWKANVLRFVSPFDHQQPWWFYVPILFGATMPWSFLWPALAYFLLSRNPRLAGLRRSALGFAGLTAAWCLAFYSLAGCKSPPYLAPIFAPLALLAGTCLDAILFEPAALHCRRLDFARQALPRRSTFIMLLLLLGCFVAGGVLGWQGRWTVLVGCTLTIVAMAAWWRYGRGMPPSLSWAACAAATLALLMLGVRGLMTGYAARHSPAGAQRLIRGWPGCADCPVVCYGRQWPSALFYFRREHLGFYGEDGLAALDEYLRNQSQAIVLVESGPLLDGFLRTVPDSLEATVPPTPNQGQLTAVVVRQRQFAMP